VRSRHIGLFLSERTHSGGKRVGLEPELTPAQNLFHFCRFKDQRRTGTAQGDVPRRRKAAIPPAPCQEPSGSIPDQTQKENTPLVAGYFFLAKDCDFNKMRVIVDFC
jgi:hypothetical protein